MKHLSIESTAHAETIEKLSAAVLNLVGAASQIEDRAANKTVGQVALNLATVIDQMIIEDEEDDE